MNDEDISGKIDRNSNPFVVEQVVGDGPDTRVRKISKHANVWQQKQSPEYPGGKWQI